MERMLWDGVNIGIAQVEFFELVEQSRAQVSIISLSCSVPVTVRCVTDCFCSSVSRLSSRSAPTLTVTCVGSALSCADACGNSAASIVASNRVLIIILIR